MRRWLERAPWPRAALGPLSFLMLLVGLVEYTRTGLYTVYLPRSYGPLFGLGAIGLAASVQYLADTLNRSLGGHLSERFGLRRVLPFAALLSAISVLGILYAPAGSWLLLASFANGLVIAPLWPSLMTLSSRTARGGEDGRAIGFTQSLVAPFIGVGVLMTGFLYDRSPQLAAGSLIAVQALIVGFGLLAASPVLPRSAHTERRRGRFPWRRIALLAPGALVQLLIFGFLTPIFFPFLDRLGFGTRDLVLALALGGGLEYLLLSPLGHLADRLGPQRTLLPALIAAALSLLAFTLVDSRATLVAVAMLAGATQALLIPTWGGLVSRLLPDEYKAGAWGALMSMEGLGFAIGPVLGGYSWELWGPRAPFFLGALAYLLVAGFYAFSLGRTAQRP